MPGDFRIASGFVEVTVRPHKDQARAAAEEVTREFEASTSTGFRAAGEHAGHEFAAGTRSHLSESLEAVLADSGSKSGTAFVEHIERVLSSAGERVKRTSEHLGDDLIDGLTGGSRGGSGGGGGPFSGIVSKFTSVFGEVKTAAQGAWSDLKQGASQVKDAFNTVTGAAGSAFSALKWPAIVAGGLELIPPVLYAIGGALASLPALAVGAGLAIASLELGTQGIGAAIGAVFNPTPGAAGGAAQRADQLAAAERNLATAERNETQAQQALNDARVQAAFHLQDLNLQMERQLENEHSARLAIMEAQQALMQAEATGDPLQIMRAQLALQEAQTGLKEQQQQTIELQYTKQQADQKGVEGSDQVVAALDRVTSATNGVLDAQSALRQATVSAAAGMVAAYSKLSPEAKKFVDEVARLKPELVGLQHYVQDQLFVGLDKKLGTWAQVWIPALRHDLGEIAGDANTFSKRLGDDLSKPAFVGAVGKVADAMDRIFTRFTTGGALDKLVVAFGDLVDKATPFIEALANSAIDKFADWADRLDAAAKDGTLEAFFKEASHDLHDIWDIGSDAFGILGDIIDIVAGQDSKLNNGKSGLDQLKDTLDGIKKWAESDKGKQTLKDIADAFIILGGVLEGAVVWAGRLFQWLDEGIHQTKSDIHGLTLAFDEIRDEGIGAFQSLVDAILGGLSTIVDGAAESFAWVPGLGPKLASSRKDFDKWVAGVNSSLDNLKTHRTITVELQQELTNQINSPGSFGHTYRWGGVRWADSGLLSLGRGSAGIYSGGPLIGFAEPDTGGELFMPRNGRDGGQQRALATVAAQWAGLDVAPARSPIAAGMGATSGGSAGSRTLQPLQIHVGGEHLVDVMLAVLEDHVEVVSATAAKGDRKRRFINSARA